MSHQALRKIIKVFQNSTWLRRLKNTPQRNRNNLGYVPPIKLFESNMKLSINYTESCCHIQHWNAKGHKIKAQNIINNACVPCLTQERDDQQRDTGHYLQMLMKFVLVTMKRKQEDKSQNKLEFNPRILQIDLTQDSKHLELSEASNNIYQLDTAGDIFF